MQAWPLAAFDGVHWDFDSSSTRTSFRFSVLEVLQQMLHAVDGVADGLNGVFYERRIVLVFGGVFNHQGPLSNEDFSGPHRVGGETAEGLKLAPRPIDPLGPGVRGSGRPGGRGFWVHPDLPN